MNNSKKECPLHNVGLIKLTQGKYAIVDLEDYDRLNSNKWHTCIIGGNAIAARKVHKDGKWKVLYMHRYITNVPEGLVVDHINHNTLDNRKINLRACTNAENSMNRATKTGTSKYKGVNFYKKSSKWRACIRVNGRFIHLGYFNNEEDAAKAYNQAAIKYFGAFAYLNKLKN